MEATWADIHELWTLLNSVQSIVSRISLRVLGEHKLGSDSEYEVLNAFEAVDADSSFDCEDVAPTTSSSSTVQPVKKKEKNKEKRRKVWRPTVEEVD